MYPTTRISWKLASLCFGLLCLTMGLFSGCGGEGQQQTCDSKDDCLAGQICVKRKCVTEEKKGCQSDTDCSAPTPQCNTTTGQCQPACKLNSDCPPGQVCQNGTCVLDNSPECIWDKDCGAGKVCQANKCVQNSEKECYQDKDCENKAHRYCATNNTCAWDCKIDSDCGVQKRCVNNRCEDSGECRSDDDCRLPTGKCDLSNLKCVACLADKDCPSDKICKNQVCEVKPGCTSDSDCQAPKSKCDTATGQCHECLADKDCPTGETCENNACKAPAGCSPACQSGEFCFVNERCLPEWKPCQEDKDCQSGERCLDAGAGKVCLINCDPTKNTSKDDSTNAGCYGGYGLCLNASQTDPTQGVCVPPYKKRRSWKETCQNLGNPQKADYHDCKDADTLCVDDGTSGVCWKKCDPKKNQDPSSAGPNPDCEAGQGTCYPLNNGGGVCEPVRPKTQKQGEGCLNPDPNKAEWADCGTGLACVKNQCVAATQDAGQPCNSTDKLCKDKLVCLQFDQATQLALCKQVCDPTKPQCPAGFLCEGISFSDPTAGACIDERKQLRNKGEACQGSDPTKPEWHNCANNAPCTQGKCGEARTQTRTKGQTCELADQGDPGYQSCQSGLSCWSNTCLTACDPTAGGGCASNEKCVEVDKNKPKEGVCRPLQGLDCDPQKTPCPSGYFCFQFSYAHRCVKPCDPTASASGCAANHTCQPFDLNDPKKGYCIPDRRPLRKKGESCHFSLPEDASYHGCQSPYVCIGLSCVDKPPATGTEGTPCDENKGCQAALVCTTSDTNQDVCARPCNPYKAGQCKTGETCVPRQAGKFYWTGGCFQQRTKTQPLGAQCKRSNATRPEYNDCQGTLVCAGSGGDTWCREACDLNTPKCPNNYACLEYEQGKGACIRKRLDSRDENQTCGLGDEKDPGYDNCKAGMLCVTFDSANQLNLCVKSCNPSQSTCAQTHRCVGVDFFDPTKGACIPNKTKIRRPGETCGGKDPRQPSYNDCLTNDHCLNNTCVDCLQTSHCASEETCRANQCIPKGACLADSDCSAPTPRCNVGSQKCVACLIDTHCPSGQVCINNTCQTRPGCQKDSDCSAPTPKCLVAARKCVACLANADCPTGQECTANTCKPKVIPPGCNPACKTGEYCYANERCLPTWTTCTSSADCKTTEICTRLGASGVCLPSCDPTKNKSQTDRSNPACYSGYGHCLALSQSSQGACVPPAKPTRDLGQTCLNRDQPQKPEYNGCKAGLECWNGTCLKERTKTQPVGAQCNRDTTQANHNDCVTTAVCVQHNDGNWCRQLCDPAAPNCPANHDCNRLSSGRGACFKKRTNTQKLGDLCGSNDSNSNGYNNCATGLTCLAFDSTTGLNLCVQNCNPSNPSCPGNHTCRPLSSGSTQGACISNRLRTRKENETCGGNDPRKADWNDCLSGFGCYQNKCIKRTQSVGAPCDAQQKLCVESAVCIVFDANNNLNFCLSRCNPQQSACPRGSTCVSTSSTDPTRGACVPTRTSTRKENETCGGSDISKPSYNSCASGLVCMGNQSNGYHCLPSCNPDATNPGCLTGTRCIRLGAGRGACAQTCTAFGTCKYGSVCTDPGSSLGFKICI